MLWLWEIIFAREYNYKVLTITSTEMVSVNEINSVSCKGNGLTPSHIEIQTITKTFDFVVSYKKEDMNKIQNAFECARINAKTRLETSSQMYISAADEGLKLKQLLDQGIITPEEFEAKKKQLLNL